MIKDWEQQVGQRSANVSGEKDVAATHGKPKVPHLQSRPSGSGLKEGQPLRQLPSSASRSSNTRPCFGRNTNESPVQFSKRQQLLLSLSAAHKSVLTICAFLDPPSTSTPAKKAQCASKNASRCGSRAPCSAHL